MSEFKEIYLEPSKCACPSSGAMWCEDSQSCNNCGKAYIKYIREDLAVSVSAIEALIHDLKSKPFVDARYLEVAKVQKLIKEAKGNE